MKTHSPGFVPWLALVAIADWLIARTLARAAIHMPKSPAMLLIYQGIGVFGQLASSLTGLLALAALAWIAWRHVRWQRSLVLAMICLALILISLLALFIPSTGWLALSFQALQCTGMLILARQAWKDLLSTDLKVAVLCTALALLASRLYQGLAALYTALGLAGPPVLSEWLYNGSELFVLLSVIALWWSFGRRAGGWIWLGSALPALAFAIPRLLAPAMTGILAIWSTGLTLYLPWPVYVGGLWLASVTAIRALREHHSGGWALLLLAAGGLAPQLSTQAFLGLIALWLLANPTGPRTSAAQIEAERKTIYQAPIALPE
jgi:hypothetical protein